jgi:hypothetical protein
MCAAKQGITGTVNNECFCFVVIWYRNDSEQSSEYGQKDNLHISKEGKAGK